MIKVAETAKEKVAVLMKEEGFDPINDYVRVGVKSGGCSGLSYELKFDNDLQENDKLFEEMAGKWDETYIGSTYLTDLMDVNEIYHKNGYSS